VSSSEPVFCPSSLPKKAPLQPGAMPAPGVFPPPVSLIPGFTSYPIHMQDPAANSGGGCRVTFFSALEASLFENLVSFLRPPIFCVCQNSLDLSPFHLLLEVPGCRRTPIFFAPERVLSPCRFFFFFRRPFLVWAGPFYPAGASAVLPFSPRRFLIAPPLPSPPPDLFPFFPQRASLFTLCTTGCPKPSCN